MPKCGDRGHVGKHGQPCQQNIPNGALGCLWHTRTAKERADLARTGAVVAKMKKALPASTEVPMFDSVEAVTRWAQDMARTALTKDVDLRRLAEARQFGNLALTALQIRTQQEMVAALGRLEYGGATVVLLEQMQRAVTSGRLRPLPGRRLLDEKEPNEYGESPTSSA